MHSRAGELGDASRKENRKLESVGAKPTEALSADVPIRKKGKKRKKRERGQKPKQREVIAPGDAPRERKLRKGKVRELDILRRNYEDERLPRKMRNVFSRLRKFGDPTSTASKHEPVRKRGPERGAVAKGTGEGSREKGTPMPEAVAQSDAKLPHSAVGSGRKPHGSSKASTQRRFSSMQPGESFADFSSRLRRESKQMILATAKKTNHQREKKRAYHAKRKERAERKQRRKRGDRSDSDVEDGDGDGFQATSHFPTYWQEILQNNGRPISAKRRKRTHREEREEDKVAFGEQAERPPQLSVVPVRRGGVR